MTEGTKYVGGFLVGEALLSILFSEDKRTISQIGRFIRIGIGAYVYQLHNQLLTTRR